MNLAARSSTQEFLDEQAALAKWYALVRTEPEVAALKEEIAFFSTLAGAVRKYTPPTGQASQQAEQAVRQFFSEGIGAGEVVDVLGIADRDRPEISVLSDDFLDNLSSQTDRPNLQIRLLKKLLDDEVHGRMRANRTRAKQFSKAIESVLTRYENRQLTSADVVAELVKLAKELRLARRRHEQLGMSEEEAAFYDALVGGAQDIEADPKLAAIAFELVQALRASNKMRVDWTDHASSQAAIRRTIKRLLRKHAYKPPAPVPNGGNGDAHSLDDAADLLYDQARELYRYWPEVDVGEQLFAEV